MGEWKLKKGEDGAVVFTDDKPVYIDPEGKELQLDPPQMYQKIIDLGKEAKGHREKADAFSTTLKLFEGIEDLTTWKDEADRSIDTVKNFNEKDWLKADKVDKLKADMKLAYEDQEKKVKESFSQQLTAQGEVLSKKDAQIRVLMVSNKFATSPFFGGPDPKTNLLPEIAETYFGKHFKVEENDKTGSLRLTAYYENGDPVYSRTNPGEIAEFDEALQSIIDVFPKKQSLLRSGGSGSGAGGGSGGGGGEPDDIKKLETEYAEAQKRGDVKAMVTIKNQLFRARQKAAA